MHLPQSARFLCLAQALCLAFAPLAAGEEFAMPSMANAITSGANNSLGMANQFTGMVGAGQTDLQNLVTQMTKMQNATAGDQTAQGHFNRIQEELKDAVGTAKGCIDKHTRSYDKFHTKHKEAGKASADRIKSVEVNCKNYGTVLDAISTLSAKISDVNEKATCIQNLQNTVNSIAEKAKQPFNELTKAAGEVYRTHTAIIDAHAKIAEKIEKEVEGENGHRARLGKLKQLSFDLTNILYGKKGEGKDGMKMGLITAVEDLKTLRTNAGNEWYFNLMQDVESCYHNQPAPCFSNDVSLPPPQCISAMLANMAQTKGEKARLGTDQGGLNNIKLTTYMKAQKINLPANLDMVPPDNFLKFTDKRFTDTLAGVVGTYNGHKFNLAVNKSQLTNFVSERYNECYASAKANFKADLDSKGGRYYAKFQSVKTAEQEAGADVTNWLNRVEGEMTDFRNSFFNTYNVELGQFKNDCTKTNDPFMGIDCLKVLSAQLDSGMRGTRKSVTLSNGTVYDVPPVDAQLTVQTLQMSPDGKSVKIGSAPVNCQGFEGCIKYMDDQRKQHSGAKAQQETDRTTFVNQHNDAVKASFAIVGEQFSKISQAITMAVNGVNTDLGKLGVNAALKTKDVEAEALKENKDTGLIEMPKSMKAALAGQGVYTEMEDSKAVTEAYNTLSKELTDKKKEANKVKGECKVEDSEYKALEGILGKDCSAKNVCRRDAIFNASNRIENIFRKSKEKYDAAGAKLGANSDYRSCAAEIKADAKEVDEKAIDDWAQEQGKGSIYYPQKYESGPKKGEEHPKAGEVNRQLYGAALKQYKAEAGKGIKADTKAECNGFILNALEAQAAEGRSDFFKEKNNSIINALRDVNDACSEEPQDEETVSDACEAFKKKVRGTSVPRDEDETPVKELGGSSNVLKNPINDTVIPVK